jgi:hypothetical protein
MTGALQVEWRWVPLSQGENAERCARLRHLLLRGARRLSACPAKGLEASSNQFSPQSNFLDACPLASGESTNSAEESVKQ